MNSITFNVENRVVRRYSPEWKKQSQSEYERLEIKIKGLLSQRDAMIDYIDQLHDTIDTLKMQIENKDPF